MFSCLPVSKITLYECILIKYSGNFYNGPNSLLNLGDVPDSGGTLAFGFGRSKGNR